MCVLGSYIYNIGSHTVSSRFYPKGGGGGGGLKIKAHLWFEAPHEIKIQILKGGWHLQF